MIEILLSLFGFPLGLILTFIAPEELKPGRKYFLIIRYVLFSLIAVFSLLLLSFHQHYSFLALYPVYLILFWFLIHYKKSYLLEIFNYLFFISLYLVHLYLQIPYLIVLPALVFLYGLPAGTLIRTQISYGKRKRS